jgi:hypothetical protein
MHRALLTSLAAPILLIACSSSAVPDAATGDDQNVTESSSRDWSANPAIVEIDNADVIYAVSDAHGHYELLAQLLEANHLMSAGAGGDPTKAKWTGGNAVLVVAGDLIDKGDQSLEVIDLLRALDASAHGRVVVTMGNHEAEFLVDPQNHKATSTGQDSSGIDIELAAQKIDPRSVASGNDAAGRGKWIANLPFGVRVKKWFFSHGGNTQRLSIKDLGQKLQHSVDHNGYADQDITGANSILEAQNWYGNPDDSNAGQKEVDALGVSHIVFGHDPGGLNDHGRILASKNGVLVKIDTAMGIHDTSGVGKAYLLHVSTKGKDSAEALDASGGSKSVL